MILPKNKIEWTYNWVSFSQEDMQCTFTLPMAEPVQTFWLPAQSLWQLYCQQLLCNNWRLVSLHVSISQPPQHSVNQLSINFWYSTSQLWTARQEEAAFTSKPGSTSSYGQEDFQLLHFDPEEWNRPCSGKAFINLTQVFTTLTEKLVGILFLQQDFSINWNRSSLFQNLV